jgi:hypothetical protein
VLSLFVVCVLAPRPLSAQVLPSQPVTLFGGRMVVTGDASISYSTDDNRTYFNYGDYDYDTMRLIRLGLAASLRLGDRVTAVADMRVEAETPGHYWRGYPTWLYLRVRPFRASSLAVSAGILQPAFGAFATRRYGADNLLIGDPLGYQYTTAVRSDALPETADDVLANRARGWAPRYPIGGEYAEVSGLPLASTHGWSPGVQVSVGTEPVQATVAVVRGSLSAPGSYEWHGGWGVSGRVEFRPTVGLLLGASGARGSFIDEHLSAIVETAAYNRDPKETALGFDAEYSAGYWLVRAEAILSRREFPAFAAPYLVKPLNAVSVDVEARYKIRPGLYAAARLGHLDFGTIEGSAGPSSWDAPVTRIEAGGGYFLARGVLVKAVYQYNWRDSAKRSSLGLVAAQLVVRF